MMEKEENGSSYGILAPVTCCGIFTLARMGSGAWRLSVSRYGR